MTAGTLSPATARGSSSRSRRWVDRVLAARPPSAPLTVAVVVTAIDPRATDRLLQSIAAACGDLVPEVVVVDDRRDVDVEMVLTSRIAPRVVRSGGIGPAGARNLGMRTATAEWVVLLDDGLTVEPSWYVDLLGDLGRAGRTVAGVAATGRDSSHGGPRLGSDVAYRRLVALSLGGFPGRFPRGTGNGELELVQRMATAGWTVASGQRPAACRPDAAQDEHGPAGLASDAPGDGARTWAP